MLLYLGQFRRFVVELSSGKEAVVIPRDDLLLSKCFFGNEQLIPGYLPQVLHHVIYALQLS